MQPSKISTLLSQPRFLPLFLTQFLGAFNDNVFKNALVVLFSYKITKDLGWDTASTVATCTALFILPFFIFSATAGQLADRFPKHSLIQATKLTEILIMATGAFALFTSSPYLLLGTLFLMGTQSAFFGPSKYAILPVQLPKHELLLGNALIEASTYIAILVGTIIGTSIILNPLGHIVTGALLLIVATSGFISSRYIPTTPAAAPTLPINPNILSETLNIIKYTTKDRKLFTTIIGISWFWYLGATLLTIIPPYVSEFLQGPESFIALLMTLFALGIGAGSLFCAKALHGELSGRYVPLSGLAISVCLYIFYKTNQSTPQLTSLASFFSSTQGLTISASLFFTAFFGGMYSVPLYTLLQAWSHPEHRARNIASKNILNALFMAISAATALLIYSLGGSIFSVLLLTTFLNILFSLITIPIVPESFSHAFIGIPVKLLYNLQIQGKENLKDISEDEPLVIISNHASLLDPAIIAPVIPFRTYYAIDPAMRQKWWVRIFLWICETFPVDPSSPYAIKKLTNLAKEGKKIVIFPEGRITTTGNLMKLYDGPALIAQKANARILPIHISGAQKTPFSYLQGKTNRSLFPQITVTIGKPQHISINPSLHGKDARRTRTDILYKMMTENIVRSRNTDFTLFQALLNAAHTHKYSSKALLDPKTASYISFSKLIASSLTLALLLTKKIPKNQPIGILMPNANVTLIAFFALQSKNRTPAMLNPTSSPENLLHACKTSQVSHIWTSKKLIDTLELQPTISFLRDNGITIHHFESLATKKKFLLPYYLLAKIFPQYLYSRNLPKSKKKCLTLPNDPATILFTSGSESTPKAVALSHKNILANRAQMTSILDFNTSDKALNPLPLFHAFGLTAATLTPLLSGVPVLLYPNPLHFGIIPELIYRENITIFFATNTLLQGYAKRAESFDFFNVRYIFAGAEKITDATRDIYAHKFGTRVFEGYGATETSPVLAVNTPIYNRPGSVGKLLPTIHHKLLPVEGITNGKKLHIQGHNVMLGYIDPNSPGHIIPPKDNWYDTGDIVQLDPQGYINIVGREKRFAKIGGERISLAIPETLASQLYPDHLHAAITSPHPTKGEQIILYSTHPEPSLQALSTLAKAQNSPNLELPSKFLHLPNIPTLPTGKPNYLALNPSNTT